MKRKIVKISDEKCNGCGLCVNACHEGALQMMDGKARLISESYCDGLGDCLPECPTGAIILEEQETVEYDQEAVNVHLGKSKAQSGVAPAFSCPSSQAKLLSKKAAKLVSDDSLPSQLSQWPCQLKLMPVNAQYLNNAHLLIAADCTAFAFPNIHQKFMRNRITLIGCPKLDNIDYSEKLTAIFNQHEIKSLTILKMEVPCCRGIVQAVKDALLKSRKMIPWSVDTISTEGKLLEE